MGELRKLVEAEIEARANDQTTYAWGGMLGHGKDLPSRILALLDVVDAATKAENLLTNLQPHIPQACWTGREAFIDNYVDPALDALRTALAALGEKP